MEGLGQLIIFSLVMLIGSYGAGSAPLFMNLSEEKLHMVSVLGAGLLLGVAFAVIIPEGVVTLIKAYNMKSQHSIQQRASIDAGKCDLFNRVFFFMMTWLQVLIRNKSWLVGICQKKRNMTTFLKVLIE